MQIDQVEKEEIGTISPSEPETKALPPSLPESEDDNEHDG